MAIPTITNIDPSSGPAAGGALVVITGTNFRVYTPPASGYVGGDDPVYVSVTFGGAEAEKIWVEADDTIVALIPLYPGDPDLESFPAMDVVVTNLDDDLVPIPGETVTAAAAFTFSRDSLRPPTLQLESPFARITRLLLQWLKRQTLLLSTSKTHTDYSPDGIILAQAGVPSVHLVGPDVVEDAYGWENPDIEEDLAGDEFQLWPNPIMHTLGYELIGQSDSQIEFLTLMGLVNKFFRRNPYLLVPGDIPAGWTVRLPLIMTEQPATGAGLANSNLHTFTCTFEVRRVPVLYLPPILAAREVDTLELQTQKFNGTLVEIKQL
jgi:hypothetical protein